MVRSSTPNITSRLHVGLHQKLPALPLGVAVQDPSRKARPRTRSGGGHRRNVRKVLRKRSCLSTAPQLLPGREKCGRPHPCCAGLRENMSIVMHDGNYLQ
ncbi:Neuropeptide Y Receptor Type 5 [Manis pentadactyla]|nr:Neuropeptide Y Receptor Type 5 [Manis pentadactyla]